MNYEYVSNIAVIIVVSIVCVKQYVEGAKANKILKHVVPVAAIVVDIEKSRFGISKIILDIGDNKSLLQFSPGTLLKSFQLLFIKCGSEGKIYTDNNSSLAWFEASEFKIWGRVSSITKTRW